MNPMLIAMAVGMIAGSLIGTQIARRSLMEAKIYGGSTAKTLHWVACAAFGGGLPAGLSDIILGNPIWNAILLAFGFIGTSFVALMLFAVVEYGPRESALAREAEQGWTAEKAKTSGL
jgi:hypothetical protein